MAPGETHDSSPCAAWLSHFGKNGPRVGMLAAAFGIFITAPVLAAPQRAKDQSPTSDIPKVFTVPLAGYDYVKREMMIPMRDGVKLHTVIVLPKGANNAPILLTR